MVYWVLVKGRGEKKPVSILTGIRGPDVIGYGDTITSSMACGVRWNDSISYMLENPEEFGYASEDEVQQMLSKQHFKIPYNTPNACVAAIREIQQEVTFQIGLHDLIFRGVGLNIDEYEVTWYGDIEVEEDQVSAFRKEKEHKFRSEVFELDTLIPLIVEEEWHPPALVGLLMTMSKYFGEKVVTDAIKQQRFRRFWM